MKAALKAVIDITFKRLISLDAQELRRRFYEHREGDIAKLILGANAIQVGELEASTFGSIMDRGDYASLIQSLLTSHIDNTWIHSLSEETIGPSATTQFQIRMAEPLLFNSLLTDPSLAKQIYNVLPYYSDLARSMEDFTGSVTGECVSENEGQYDIAEGERIQCAA